MSIVLFDSKKNCCGCKACLNICPHNAIVFKQDKYGFSYPEVKDDVCINCGMCQKVCDFQRNIVEKKEPIECCGAINKDLDVLKRSTSGGVFGALAEYVLENDGVVFGCVYDEGMMPIHVCAVNRSEVLGMHGSKYVQSDVGTVYRDVKERILSGKVVLFTGTPCQVAALKAFLRHDYENLITADFVCHGVPSAKMFCDYISYLERKHKINIVKYEFRSKKRTWPRFMSLYKTCKTEKKMGWATEFYFPYFLKSRIYRDSCYDCKYAQTARVSDFTMGDFWGYERMNLSVDVSRGLSICLANSQKAVNIKDKIQDKIDFIESDIETIKLKNRNLNAPSVPSADRSAILEDYANKGVDFIAKKYLKENRKSVIKSRVQIIMKTDQIGMLVKRFKIKG